MTLGSFTAVMIYLAQLLGFAKSISGFYESMLISSVSSQRLSEILDIKPRIQDAQDAIDYHILRGRIEFKGISFGYRNDERILEGINFSIEPAAKIALIGSSGCGNSR